MSIFKWLFSNKEITEKQTFNVDQVSKVNIKSDNSTIDIEKTKESGVIVEFTVSERKRKKYDFDVKEGNDSLTIDVKQKKKYSGFSWFGRSSIPMIKLYLPEKQYEALNVEVINGKINVHNLQVEHTSINTVNGAITLMNIQAKATNISSQNGKIYVKNAEGDFATDVVNGSATILTAHLERNMDISTVNGRINIHTEKAPTNSRVEVDVVNGKVDVLGKSVQRTVVGDGHYLVKLSTVNGSVSITE